MTNVLLLMSDEHNPRYSSVYGHPFVRTPNLDRLAEQGTVYENAYCPSPLCVPSRSAFMTGRYAHEIQRYNNCKVIEARDPSYGQLLAEQGVHTGYIGSAANLYRHPHQLGFTEMLLAEVTQRQLDPDAVRADVPRPVLPKTEADHGPVWGRFDQDLIFVDRAVQWLQETAPKLAEPWTMTVNVHPPHPPYTSDPEHWARYEGLGDLPEHGSEQSSAMHPYNQDLRNRGGWDYGPALIRELRQGYYAMISYVDDELGRLLDALEAAGLAGDTVVCYTTDHGDMLGTFGVWGKCSLYEDSVRVPIVAAGPGFGRGARVRTPVSLLDLQAAIFHAVGADRPGHWRGEPLQTIPNDDRERVVFAEYHGAGVRGSGYLIRRGDWKLIFNADASDQLFDLAEDPSELVDLWAERPKVVAELEQELRKICDPIAEHRAAEEFSRRQVARIGSLQDQLGPDVTEVPWSESAGREPNRSDQTEVDAEQVGRGPIVGGTVTDRQ
ncbi:MAG TPA: sulfatase-like hydrolase/transferase [Microlunatus sp.]